MDNYYLVFFVFSILIYIITVLINSNEKLNNNFSLLRTIKIIAILFPTLASIFIVMLLFNNINYIIKNIDRIGMESITVSSGLSIFGILASVWVGLNIYNTVEKKEIVELRKVTYESIENSKKNIDFATKKLKDIAMIQVKSIIADSQESMLEKEVYYNSIIKQYNNYDLSYILRGNFLKKNKKYNEAIADYNIALLKNNENVFLYYDRGKCYYDNENYINAIDDFTTSISSDLYSNASYKNRALTYQKIKEYDKAIIDYTKIVDLMDPDHSTYNNRGYCYFQVKEYLKAINDYDKAINLSQGNEKTYFYNRLYAHLSIHDDLIINDNDKSALKYNLIDIMREIDMIISKFKDKNSKLYLLRYNVNLALGNTKEAEFDNKMYEKLSNSNPNKEAAISNDNNDKENKEDNK